MSKIYFSNFNSRSKGVNFKPFTNPFLSLIIQEGLFLTRSDFGSTKKGATQIPGLNPFCLICLATVLRHWGNFLRSVWSQSPQALDHPSSIKIYSNDCRGFLLNQLTLALILRLLIFGP